MALVLVTIMVLTVAGFTLALRSRARLEFRAEFFDRLAHACRRAVPLLPFLAALAQGRREREQQMIESLSARIAEGDSLADALATLPRSMAPPHVIGAVRAAEGTSRLPAVLASVADDAGDALSLRHRAFLIGLYPLFLIVLVLSTHLLMVRYFEHRIGGGNVGLVFPSADSPEAWIALGLVSAVLLAVLVGVGLRLLGLSPGARRIATARVLRTSGLLVEAGLPVTTAFERAAGAAGSRRFERVVKQAAARVEAGEDVDGFFDVLRLPAVDRLRLQSAGRRIGDVMQDVSASCVIRWRAWQEGWMRRMGPITILAVGLLVFIDFRIVMGTLERLRFEAGLW